VLKARYLCRSLLRARMELPQYQLISFLALTLSYDQAELATADKLAERVAQQTAGNSSMAAILTVLNEIVSSERFEPVETENLGSLHPPRHHHYHAQSQGADWDYVFCRFARKRHPRQFLGTASDQVSG